MLAKHTLKRAYYSTSAKTNRVVVTGMGIVSPIGVGKEENWKNILAGKSGIVSLKGEKEFEGLKSQIGGKLPSNFNINEHKTSVRLNPRC
jgi:3-oxoacyl-[acyl-carrier-protein] synthase II